MNQNNEILEKQIRDAKFSIEWHARQLEEYTNLLNVLEFAQKAMVVNV